MTRILTPEQAAALPPVEFLLCDPKPGGRYAVVLKVKGCPPVESEITHVAPKVIAQVLELMFAAAMGEMRKIAADSRVPTILTPPH